MAQYPVKNGWIEMFEVFIRDKLLPAEYHGRSEAAFEEELRQVLR